MKKSKKAEKAAVWIMFLVVIGLLGLIAVLNSGCVPLEDEGEGDADFEDLLDTGMTGDDILMSCSYIQGELDAWQATCVDGYTEPPWFNDYVPNETPEVCSHYGSYCWKCGQIYGSNPTGDEFRADEVLGCLEYLTYAPITCDDGYIEAAEYGPCWLIASGGILK